MERKIQKLVITSGDRKRAKLGILSSCGGKNKTKQNDTLGFCVGWKSNQRIHKILSNTKIGRY